MAELYRPVTYDSEGAGRAILATVLLEAFLHGQGQDQSLRQPAAGQGQALNVSARLVRN
jgi:hypothetical protein